MASNVLPFKHLKFVLPDPIRNPRKTEARKQLVARALRNASDDSLAPVTKESNKSQPSNIFSLGNNIMSYCPVEKAYVSFDDSYPIEIESSVPLHMRSADINSAIPTSPINGGLYGGPQAVGPYASIPVIPTATNYTFYNLQSANPPPGATVQHIGTNRLGNNYTAMPGVYWANNKAKGMDSKFNIKVVKE